MNCLTSIDHQGNCTADIQWAHRSWRCNPTQHTMHQQVQSWLEPLRRLQNQAGSSRVWVCDHQGVHIAVVLLEDLVTGDHKHLQGQISDRLEEVNAYPSCNVRFSILIKTSQREFESCQDMILVMRLEEHPLWTIVHWFKGILGSHLLGMLYSIYQALRACQQTSWSGCWAVCIHCSKEEQPWSNMPQPITCRRAWAGPSAPTRWHPWTNCQGLSKTNCCRSWLKQATYRERMSQHFQCDKQSLFHLLQPCSLHGILGFDILHKSLCGLHD